MYIFHKQVHFACIKTYQVFLNIANSISILNTCSSIAGDQNCLLPKAQNCFNSFIFVKGLFHDNLLEWFTKEALHLLASGAPSD